VSDPAAVQDVLAWIVGQGLAVASVTPLRPSLEQLFMAAAEASSTGAPGRQRQA
jgi:hypothetical protein